MCAVNVQPDRGADGRPRVSRAALDLDCAAEVERISRWLVDAVARQLHRRGAIIALSGGIDSSVCGALAVRAFGADKVFGLLLPERDSSPTSSDRGMQVAKQLGIRYELEHIAPTLEAIGCYKWRDEAIRAVFPEYGDGWKNKIVIAGGAQGGVNFFKLVVQSPAGVVSDRRLPIRQYLQIVGATNYKQRIRKTIEYFHADRLNYAVIGTPNLLEYDQGFFVKNGDGAADVKPIAHLYKTQVYALARHLGLPEDVCNADPTTDTYSMPQGQDEFYFALPYAQMDLALWGYINNVTPDELAPTIKLTPAQIVHVYNDIASKRRAAHYLHSRPLVADTATNAAPT